MEKLQRQMKLAVELGLGKNDDWETAFSSRALSDPSESKRHTAKHRWSIRRKTVSDGRTPGQDSNGTSDVEAVKATNENTNNGDGKGKTPNVQRCE